MSENTSTNVKHSDLTPYRAAQVATAVLRVAGKLGVDGNGKPKTIEPQSMYSNKTIKRHGSAKSAGGSGVMFDGESFNEWLQAQLRGTGTTRRSSDFGSLLAEYTGELSDEDVSDEVGDEEDEEDEDSAEDIAAMTENSFEKVADQADTSALTTEKSEDEELAELEASDAEVAE
jgi:hypothetical protein